MAAVTQAKFDEFVKEVRTWRESVNDLIAKLSSRMEKAEATIETVTKQSDKTHKILFGNGEIGMDERIRDIFEYIQAQKKAKEKEEGERTWFRRMVVGVLTVNAFTVLGALFFWLWKMIPILNDLAAKAGQGP